MSNGMLRFSGSLETSPGDINFVGGLDSGGGPSEGERLVAFCKG